MTREVNETDAALARSDDTADESGTSSSHIPVDEGFNDRVLASFKEMFWDSEIERRGGLKVTGPLFAALAILHPGKPVEVRLNDEVEVVARAREGAPMENGTQVTEDNLAHVETIEPLGVDPNAGWVAWLIMPGGGQYARFDLLRNRQRSLTLLDLARQYLTTAEEAVTSERPGPALENALAAAELVITARTYSFAADEPKNGAGRNSHSARKHWTKVQVGLGNTTADAHHTLGSLNRLRGAARYGEGELPAIDHVCGLVSAVKALIDDAATRIGQPLRTQNPDFLASMAGDVEVQAARADHVKSAANPAGESHH